jgi:hypothetical protein
MAAEPILPDFDYFSKEPVQNAIRRVTYEKVLPTGTLQHGGDITFNVPRSTAFTALHETALYVRVKVTKANKVACNHAASQEPDSVSVVNNVVHTLWKQVCVYLNGHLAESSDSYPYRAYVDTLTSFDGDVMSVRGELQGWMKDTAGHGDEAEVLKSGSKNEGGKLRGEPFKNSSVVLLIARLHSDVFLQGRSIPPSTSIDVVLSPSKDSFVLTAPSGSAYEMHIESAYLDVARQHVAPSLLQAITSLTEQQNVQLRLRRVKATTYNIKSGTTQETIPKLFYSENALPDRFLVFFVKNTAHAGKYECNPFLFEHFGIETLVADVNGINVPCRPYETKFSRGDYRQAYHALLREFNSDEENHVINLTPKDFSEGYAIFPFRVVPRTCSGEYLGPPEKGNISLSLKFASALTEVITAVILSEHRDTYEIRPAGDASVTI